MTDTINTVGLSNMAMSPGLAPRGRSSNWFEAFATAWGQALDNQASRIQEQSDQLSAGMDKPSEITKLTAESMRMTFMANSSHTSLDSVSKALETMSRKS